MSLAPMCCKATVCLTATGLCTLQPLSGAQFTLTDPGGHQVGAVQTTGSSGKVCWQVTATGVYTWSGVWAGKTQTGSLNVTSLHCQEFDGANAWQDQLCINVAGCFGNISGATVSITPGGSGTTNGSGQFCLTFTSASTLPATSFSVTVTLPTGPSKTQTVAYGTCNFGFTFIDQLCVQVYKCDGVTGLSGASVTVTATGVSCSGTTNGSGLYCCIPTVVVDGLTTTITVTSAPEYASQTQTPTAQCTTTFFMAAASGYNCCASQCGDPVPTTLHLTDVSGTYANTSFGASPSCDWNFCATQSVTQPACAGGTASVKVFYALQLTGGIWKLEARWAVKTIAGCTFYDPTITCAQLQAGSLSPPDAIDKCDVTLSGTCSSGTVSLSGTIGGGCFTFLPCPTAGGITVTN